MMATTKEVASRLLRKAAVAAIGCCMSFSAMATGYVATILPTLGGSQTVPKGIDSSGGVTGESHTGTARHAFLWKNGTMTDLGVLNIGGSVGSWGFKSNPAGQVTGTLFGGAYPYAFGYANGVMTDIAYNGYGYGINAAGEMVGGSNGRAFLYRDGVLNDLGTFGYGSATARAINNAGAVVGYVSAVNGSGLRSFVWKNGEVTIIEPMAGDSTIALDVNDAGEILGMTSIAADPNAWHVFTWKNGVMTDTGISAQKYTIPSEGYAINNAGHVLTPTGMLNNGVFTPVADMLPPELAPGLRDGFYWVWPKLTSMNDAGQVTGIIAKRPAGSPVFTTIGYVLTPAAVCN